MTPNTPTSTPSTQNPTASGCSIDQIEHQKQPQQAEANHQIITRRLEPKTEHVNIIPPQINQHYDAVSSHDLDLSDVEDQEPPSEFVRVDLRSIRKEVQCPICLGIIKKTRTVMECLHRFCRECIDKSMRMGKKECPACRKHCASRRSLRDDPRFDELIAALYPDIKKFEEEELAFYEEDESHSKQIQHSITQVIAKQTEALCKKRYRSKDIAGPSSTRPQHTQSRKRRRRKNVSVDYQYSDDHIDTNDIEKYISPDEHNRETTQKKQRKRATVSLTESPTTTLVNGCALENNLEQSNEEKDLLPPGVTCSSEMVAWGKGGVRSTTRHGNINGSINESARRIRLTKLVDFLRNLEENENECMALDTPLKIGSTQLLGKRDANGFADHCSTFQQPSSVNNEKLSEVAESLQDKLYTLDTEETFSVALPSRVPNAEELVSACQPANYHPAAASLGEQI